MTEAEKRIRATLGALDPAVLETARKELGSAFIDCTLHAQAALHVARYLRSCSPENITALLADRDEREAALRAEVERLKAAIDMQPSPPTREDMEWAGKVHLAEAEKENDALRAEVEALRAALHTCLWAMRQPIDGWKGDCERKAMDKANAALAQAKEG